jgi:hypothetical protein
MKLKDCDEGLTGTQVTGHVQGSNNATSVADAMQLTAVGGPGAAGELGAAGVAVVGAGLAGVGLAGAGLAGAGLAGAGVAGDGLGDGLGDGVLLSPKAKSGICTVTTSLHLSSAGGEGRQPDEATG